MPCTICGMNGHNRGTCEKAVGIHKRPRLNKPRGSTVEFMDVPRGFRPVRLPDGQVMLMKHEHLYPEKVQCECGVNISAVECAAHLASLPRSATVVNATCAYACVVLCCSKRALLRHQKTKGHLDWASRA